MSEGTPAGSGSRVLTIPNAISALRIALIPVFVTLIVDDTTTTAGLIMFGLVVATDWVDGTIARRTALGRRVHSPLGDGVRRHGPWRSLVSASDWGSEGRRFESGRPDGWTRVRGPRRAPAAGC